MIHRVTTSCATTDNKRQRLTTNDSEWYKPWQRVVQRETRNGNDKIKTSGNEWSFWLLFPFFEKKRNLSLCTLKITLKTLRRILKRDYWINSKNKSLRRNINRKKQESIETVFLFVIHTTLKISEHSMTQTCPSDFFLGQFRPTW